MPHSTWCCHGGRFPGTPGSTWLLSLSRLPERPHRSCSRDLCIASDAELPGEALGPESSRALSVPQSSPKAGGTAVLEGTGGSGFLSEFYFPTALKDAPRNARSLMHSLQPQGSHTTRHSLLAHIQICMCVHTHPQPTYMYTQFLHCLWTPRAGICAHHASFSPNISKPLEVHRGAELPSHGEAPGWQKAS